MARARGFPCDAARGVISGLPILTKAMAEGRQSEVAG
jgi:hypothetical protein